MIGVVVYATPITEPDEQVTASVTTRDVITGKERAVEITARVNPADGADDAHWFLVTAWQGEEGRSVVSKLEEIAPGVWRTQEPVPVHGTWKTTLRLHKGSSVEGMAVYFPPDKAIPVEGIPATASFTRPFMEDKELLLREQKPDASGALVLFGYLIVLLIAVILVGSIVAGLRRLENVTSRPGAKPVEREPLVAAADVAGDGDEAGSGRRFERDGDGSGEEAGSETGRKFVSP